MAKKDIEIGMNAAGNDDAKSFNPDDTDARKKRIEEARKLLEDYPAEDVSEEEKPVEEPKTTIKGLGAAVVRGVAPTAVEMTGGGIIGGLAGLPFGAAGPGARIGAQAAPVLSQLSDLAVTGVNAIYGTHYTGPKEAITHWLDEKGFPKPESSAEKVVEAATDYASSGFGLAKGLGAAAKVIPAGKAKGVLEMLGEGPKTQAAVLGLAGAAEEKTKQEYGSLAGLGAGLATGIAAGSVVPALTAGGKAALSALKDVNVPAIEKSLNVLKEFAAPKVEVPTPTITETAAKALRGKTSAKQTLAESAAGEIPILGVTPSQAASELGLTQVPQEFISGSPEYQALAKKAVSATESITGLKQKEFLDKLSEKANKIIESSGGKKDLSSLSDDIKTSMINKIKDLDAEDDVLYNQIRKIAKPETQVDLDQIPLKQNELNALDAVKSKLKELGGNADLLSPIEKQILSALSPKPIINEIGENIGFSNPTIGAIRTLKSKVGSILSGEKTFPNETIGNAKYYYGKLADAYTKSIQPILEESGQPELLNYANSIVKQRKEIEEKAINLFGEKLSDSISGKITRATQAASKGDAEKIRAIVESVPEKYRAEVIASGINNAITKGDKLDIDNFIKWHENLRQNEASYDALFQGLPARAKYEVDNLYVMSKNIQNYLGKSVKVGDLKEAINSSVNLASKIKKIGTSLIAGSVAYQTSKAIGLPHELSAALMTAVTGATIWDQMAKSSKVALSHLDEFLTSGEFARYVANAKGDSETFSRSIPQMMREPFYQNFAKQVGPETAKRIIYEATQLPSKDQTESTEQ